MSRPLRIQYQGALYHVMNQGRNADFIFLDERDILKFLAIVARAVEEYQLVVYAYAVMGNHFHLLVKTPKGNLADCMRYINSMYAQWFNKKYGLTGSLFRGRYKSRLIERKGHFLTTLQYIHRNPLRAGLEEMIGEYQWTSHKGYVDERKREDWLTVEPVLRRFSKDERTAQEKYWRLVHKELSKEEKDIFEGKEWKSIIGSEEFIKRVKARYLASCKKYPEQPSYRKDFIYLEGEREKIKEIYKEDRAAFRSPKRREYGNKRRALIYIMRKEYLVKFSEIGKNLGDVTYSAISKQYKKAKEEIEKQTGCYEQVKRYLEKIRA